MKKLRHTCSNCVHWGRKTRTRGYIEKSGYCYFNDDIPMDWHDICSSWEKMNSLRYNALEG